MKRSSAIKAAALVSLLCLAAPMASRADRGMFVISADPDITLTEGAQRAVIAFNGNSEILILGTEASATVEGKVLEFLPLPSAPVIEEATSDIFEHVIYLINSRAPKSSEPGTREGNPARGGLPGIEVVSEASIGPHDVTVVKIESADYFLEWIGDFYKRAGIASGPAKAHAMKDIVDLYLKRGVPYFVFDVVTVKKEKTGIAPLLYRFETGSLYYPLEISSKTAGDTEIDLFLVTPGAPKEGSFPKGFSIPNYVFPTDIFGSEKTSTGVPISFPVSMIERVGILPAFARLIPGWETKTYFTAVRYRGPLSGLFGDFTLDKSDFKDADFDGVKDAIDRRATLSDSAPPGTRDLVTMSGEGAPSLATSASGSETHYLGREFFSVEKVTFPASYTSDAAVDGDASTPFILRSNESWQVDLGAAREIDTVDILAAVPIPDKDTTYTYGIRLLASDSGRFAGEQKMVGSALIESYTEMDKGDDPTHHETMLRLTERPIRARYLRIEYIPYGAYNDLLLFEVMPWVKGE